MTVRRHIYTYALIKSLAPVSSHATITKYISEIFAVLVLAGAAQAAPAAHAALSGSEEEPFHQEAWRKIDIAAFREMSLEQRLELHSKLCDFKLKMKEVHVRCDESWSRKPIACGVAERQRGSIANAL